jgi:hypothetical protein
MVIRKDCNVKCVLMGIMVMQHRAPIMTASNVHARMLYDELSKYVYLNSNNCSDALGQCYVNADDLVECRNCPVGKTGRVCDIDSE